MLQKALGTEGSRYSDKFEYNGFQRKLGILICLRSGFPTITVTTRVSNALHTKLYMDVNVILHYTDLKPPEGQNSYADNCRKLLKFQVDDKVTLKVSLWKALVHYGKKGKLSPRPFENPLRL